MAERTNRQPAEPSRSVTAMSDDKVLTFHLAARPGGVAVQRSERRAGGRRVVQSVRFADEASFVRWCQSDELRFAYPLLFSKLSRSGCELFNAAP